MKRIWLFVVWLCILLFTWNFTQAQPQYWYPKLDITANIMLDWTIDVKEDFTSYFSVHKHWIIRDIPLNYSVRWKEFHIEISNIDVEWKRFTTDKYNWRVVIKIWDENKTIIWEQHYPISYSTYGLIRNFSWKWYAELYWNLVGYGFDTNIDKVRAEIILPKAYTWLTTWSFLITTDWKYKTIDWFEWTVDRSQWDRIIITYDKWLPAYQGITLAIKFPNNYFEFDHERQAGLAWTLGTTSSEYNYSYDQFFIFQRILTLIIFLIVAIILFVNTYWKKVRTWWKKTRLYTRIELNTWKLRWKYAKLFPVFVQYEPPQWLNSAEVWLLLHRKAKAKDLFSLIYKRANENLIKIQYTSDGSVVIIKLKDISEDCPKYEQKFFNNLLRKYRRVIEKGADLHETLNLNDLKEYWFEKWWLQNNDKIEIVKSIIWWIWAMFILYFFSVLLSFIFGGLGEYLFIVSFTWIWKIVFFWWIILFILSLTLKECKEAEEWAKLISHILWYREFLAACDGNKLRLFLKEDPSFFDKTLPYAVVFWLETELIERITPIIQELHLNSVWCNWDISLIWCIWDITSLSETISAISSVASYSGWFSSSYSSDSGWDSWSSFSWWWSSFSSWWGGWWWGWRSW